jgi:IS5 family transposase
MQGQQSSQISFFGTIYDALIPKDHLLQRIHQAVDFRFVAPLVADCYCPDNGRKSWDPVILFKMVFLQFLYDLSDREIEDQVNLHLACKWFVGLMPEETAPDHTRLSNFRVRLGAEKFQDIFNEIVESAKRAGLVHDRLRIIDATHIEAKVDLFRLKREEEKKPEEKREEKYVDKNSPDADARFGHKTKKKSFYGYKEHIAVDADSEIITAVKVTPGNVADGDLFKDLVDKEAREATADKAYDTDENHGHLKGNGQKSSIIVKKNRTDENIVGQADKASQKERPKIEHKFGEQKKYHGIRRARYWGLFKVKIQVLLTCIVVNCKKIAKLIRDGISQQGKERLQAA